MYSRADIHNEITSKFGRHGRILLLTDTILDKCDEWYANNNVENTREIRKSLKSYIMQEVNISKGDNPYTFIPAFIWIWIAGQIISLVIQLWLKKNNII